MKRVERLVEVWTSDRNNCPDYACRCEYAYEAGYRQACEDASDRLQAQVNWLAEKDENGDFVRPLNAMVFEIRMLPEQEEDK